MQQKVPFSLIRCSSSKVAFCSCVEWGWHIYNIVESESDPLTRRAVDLFEKEPLKGNSEVHLHTPTKFGEDRSKDLGGDREQTDRQTNRQTDKRCSIYSMIYCNTYASVRNGRPSVHLRRRTFHAGRLNSKLTCPPDGQLFQSFIKTPGFIYVLLVLFYWSKQQQRFCALVPSTKLLYASIREWCEWWDGDNMNDMLDIFFWHGIWLTLIENAVKCCALILKIRTKLCLIFSTNK